MQQSEAAQLRRRNQKRVRVLLLLACIVSTFSAGMYTPGPQATLFSRIVLVVFSLSFLMSLSVAAVIVPSTPDPRESMRNVLWGWRRDSDEDRSDGDESLYTGIPSPSALQKAAVDQRGRR